MKNIIRIPKTHPLTWCLRDDRQSVWLGEYRSKNGYKGVHKALTGLSPDEIVNQVKNSGLKGRGGAGFSTDLKWSLVPKDKSTGIRHLLCSVDEMEPGTYKDRLLIKQPPRLLVESMLIFASALKAYRGYIFLRDEYIETAVSLRRVIAEAIEADLPGKNIVGTGPDFRLFIHTGARRYICGEETALINSLEGCHTNPCSKPPFPVTSGAWGRPTRANNVETLCSVPAIFTNGVGWYQNVSKSKDVSTRLMGLPGRVRNSDLRELSFGTTIREVLEDYAGGIRDGLRFKVWQPSGARTGFLTETHFDLPVEFKSIGKAGNRLDTALVIVVNHEISMMSPMYDLEEFFARESYG